jgi:hypothetical protein
MCSNEAMVAGYSGTPLKRKLGLQDGHAVVVVNEPAGFRDLLDTGPDELAFGISLRGTVDVAIVFVTDQAELRRRRDQLGRAIYPDGAIWVAWPKKSSKVPTDVTEDTVRDVFLPHGLVDNKVCAIDDTWSGLRVVWRKENRKRSRLSRSQGR